MESTSVDFSKNYPGGQRVMETVETILSLVKLIVNIQ